MLEKRMYKVILGFAVIISVISIVTNFIAKFPIAIQGKWILLCVITIIAYYLRNKYNEIPKFIYFIFIVCIFMPFGWIDSGGSSNNTIGYVFILIISITYLFKKYKRSFLIIATIIMFDSMIFIENFYPEIIKSYSDSSQFIDRMIQIPIIIISAYFLIKKFDTAYNIEKNALNDSRKKLEFLNEELYFYANYDKLTSAANRRMFDKYLGNLLKNKNFNKAYLILIDFDNFKYINDHFGHVKGDEILYTFVEIAKEYFVSPNIISRWGGDEFAIIYHGSFEELLIN